MANQKDLEKALRYSELRKQGKYDEASKIDLSHAHLTYADLSGANLSGALISIGNVNRRIQSD